MYIYIYIYIYIFTICIYIYIYIYPIQALKQKSSGHSNQSQHAYLLLAGIRNTSLHHLGKISLSGHSQNLHPARTDYYCGPLYV